MSFVGLEFIWIHGFRGEQALRGRMPDEEYERTMTRRYVPLSWVLPVPAGSNWSEMPELLPTSSMLADRVSDFLLS